MGAAQGNRGRHGRDPVQAVEDDEHPHAGLDAGREHGIQRQQREAAAAVVGDEQPARVDPVGEPARGDRADDVEDADDGEQAGGGRRRHPVVVGGGHEVGLDDAVGRPAAHPEGEHERPERPAAAGLAQHVDGHPGGRGAGALRLDDDAARLQAVGEQAVVGRAVAQERDDEHGHEQRQHGDDAGRGRATRRPTAVRAMSGRKSSCPVALAAEKMPVTSPRWGWNQRLATIAPKTRAIAPVPMPMNTPHSSHSCHGWVMTDGQPARDPDDDQRGGDRAPHAEALHEGGGERRDEAVEHEVEAHRPGGDRPRPAELGLDRLEQHPGGAAEGRGRDEGAERHGGHDPRPVPPRARRVTDECPGVLGHRASIALGSAP